MDSTFQLIDDINDDSILILDNVSETELLKAHRKCSEIVKHSASNFYYAFVFLPTEQRYGIEALYAFCRAGDDVADDRSSGKTGLLQKLRKRLDLCYNEQYLDKSTLALAWAIKRFRFNREHFDDLLLGIESDLTVKRYATFNDLRLYCYRVASTVGLLCLNIFGCDNQDNRLYAENLGIGMQLTNILRDLKEDADRNRIYIPQEDLHRFDIIEDDIFAPANNHSLIEMVRWEAERAKQFFQEAEAHLKQEMRKPMFAARIMGSIYEKILGNISKLERFEKRVELTAIEKLAIARMIFTEAFKG
ncbi:MAG: squalene/phytoene synthase family protein [Candidatus Hatepunaea meridiana]|nr:squalene/phytoene synthase family protein [Candidatus Hatepunaea meridiana]